VAVAPLALYATWYAAYGAGKTNYDSAGHALKWAVNAGAAAFGGFAGGGLDRGRVLLGIMVLVVVVCVARGLRPTPRAVGVVVTAVVFYVLTGFARQLWQSPTTTRYIYLGAVAIVLLAAELLRGTRTPPWALGMAGVLAVASAAVNFDWLNTQAEQLQAVAGTVRIELAAVELAHDYVPRSFVPPYSFAHAGPYLDAVAELGSSPAVPRSALTRLSPDGRRLVDQTLQKVGGISLSLRTSGRIGGAPPQVLSGAGGTVRLTFGCAELTSSAGRFATIWVQPAGARLRVVAATSPTEIRAARFGDGTTLPSLGTASAHGKVDVVTQPDALRAPAWRVRLATHGRALACSLR
jgi:hypothetical protein